MDIKRRQRIISIYAFALLIFTISVPAARAQTTVDIGALLQQTGLKYSSVKDPNAKAWKVPYDDGKGGTVNEYVAYSNGNKDFALIWVTVVDRAPGYNFSYALLTRAMQLNNDEGGIKFVLDGKHGDIDCQTEVYLPTATPQSLRMALDNVAKEATDEWQEMNSL